MPPPIRQRDVVEFNRANPLLRSLHRLGVGLRESGIFSTKAYCLVMIVVVAPEHSLQPLHSKIFIGALFRLVTASPRCSVA
jgi:hypothetical protein